MNEDEAKQIIAECHENATVVDEYWSETQPLNAIQAEAFTFGSSRPAAELVGQRVKFMHHYPSTIEEADWLAHNPPPMQTLGREMLDGRGPR